MDNFTKKCYNFFNPKQNSVSATPFFFKMTFFIFFVCVFRWLTNWNPGVWQSQLCDGIGHWENNLDEKYCGDTRFYCKTTNTSDDVSIVIRNTNTIVVKTLF